MTTRCFGWFLAKFLMKGDFNNFSRGVFTVFLFVFSGCFLMSFSQFFCKVLSMLFSSVSQGASNTFLIFKILSNHILFHMLFPETIFHFSFKCYFDLLFKPGFFQIKISQNSRKESLETMVINYVLFIYLDFRPKIALK